jgi:hypothetical protein
MEEIILGRTVQSNSGKNTPKFTPSRPVEIEIYRELIATKGFLTGKCILIYDI